HSETWPFICGDCGKSFRQSWRPIQHRRTYTGEKPYSSTASGKSFSLIQHYFIHTGEKSFTCADCSMSF
ncbi:Zinc finger protein 787, partial [Dryobates pubescens]